MTQQDAVDMIEKLRANKTSWPRIAEALKTGGYISARTGEPIGHLMARHMYEKLHKRDKVVRKREAREDAVVVKAVDNTMMEDVKKLLNAGVSVQMQKQLLKWVADQLS